MKREGHGVSSCLQHLFAINFSSGLQFFVFQYNIEGYLCCQELNSIFCNISSQHLVIFPFGQSMALESVFSLMHDVL